MSDDTLTLARLLDEHIRLAEEGNDIRLRVTLAAAVGTAPVEAILAMGEALRRSYNEHVREVAEGN